MSTTAETMFQTGNRANPGGARKSKQWAEAIRKAALRPIDPKDEATHLDALAQQLIAKGLQGDTAALKEIGDRIDGKAIQSIEAEVTVNITSNKNSNKYIDLQNFDMEEEDVIFLKFTNSSLYNNCVKKAWQKIRR